MRLIRTSFPVRRARRSTTNETTTPPTHMSSLVPIEDEQDFLSDARHDDEQEKWRAPERPWLKKTVLILIALALFAHLLAFWPYFWNAQIAIFLNKNRELENDPRITQARSAIALMMMPDGQGTGFNIHPDGFLLTNAHVVGGYKHVLIQFAPQSNYKGEVIWRDSDIDLALVAVRDAVTNTEQTMPLFPSLPLAQERTEEMYKVGEKVLVIGNPLFYTDIASTGTIEGWVKISGHEKKVLALNVPIYKGHSGSPVFDERGQVIAIVFATATRSRQNGEQTVGLAIPVSDFIDRIKTMLP